MELIKNTMRDTDNYTIYVMATRSSGIVAKLIRKFSSRSSKLPEFDHVVLVYRANEYHMTHPHAEKRPVTFRPHNTVYKVINVKPKEFWNFVHTEIKEKTPYVTWQLITKSFTMMFGWNPVKAYMDCIDFVVKALVQPYPKDVDRWTVGQGIQHLVDNNIIKHVEDFENY